MMKKTRVVLVLFAAINAAPGAKSAAEGLPPARVFAFPNPARTQTTFRFESEAPDVRASIKVFDIAGNIVITLGEHNFKSPRAGVHHADWDLRNSRGESVAPGVYLFMVETVGSGGAVSRIVKKLAVVK